MTLLDIELGRGNVLRVFRFFSVFVVPDRWVATVSVVACGLFLMFCTPAQGVVPVVSNVRAVQQFKTHVVEITYDVAASENALLNVSVAVSSDGGVHDDVPATHFSGAGFGSSVLPGNKRRVVWDAGADWLDRYSDAICFKLTVSTGSSAVRPAGMVLIPEGTFAMGDAPGDGSSHEQPIHTVAVNAVYMDAWEVTNEKMCEVMQWAIDQVPPLVRASANGVSNRVGDAQLLLDLSAASRSQILFSGGMFSVEEGKETYPCVAVTWFGAAAFCNYRSLMEGVAPCYRLTDWQCDWNANGYRLPTEAEWEKAARGGSENQRFPGSMTLSHD